MTPSKAPHPNGRTLYRKFQGALAEEYRLLKLAYPNLDEFEQQVGECAKKYKPAAPSDRISVVEIGCGDGITTNVLLSARDDMLLTAIDIAPAMIKQAKDNLERWEDSRDFQFVTADAVKYLAELPDDSVDIIASAWTLHNIFTDDRSVLLRESLRCLKPGGLFINGDKYAQEPEEHFQVLYEQMRIFFDVYLPIGKLEFLKEFVLHNLADEAPNTIMYESDAISEMQELGYVDITMTYRKRMEAVLVAYRAI